MKAMVVNVVKVSKLFPRPTLQGKGDAYATRQAGSASHRGGGEVIPAEPLLRGEYSKEITKRTQIIHLN
jgi:hypothetical protein